MKTKLTLIIAFIFTIGCFAQTGFNYKAVIKDASGNILISSPISIQFIIYEGAALTNNVYQESHTLNTNGNGIIIVNIGAGATGEVFADVSWGSDEHFLNVQVNTGGGLVDMGTTQFMAVPYALNALTSSDNHWSQIGSGINTSNFTVGINSENPAHTLDVRSISQAEPAGLNVSNNDRSRYVRFFSGSEMFPDPSLSWAPGHDFLFATFDDNTFDFQEKMRISSTGNVGIGIADPQVKLDIQGGDYDLEAGNQGDLRIGNETHRFKIGIDTTASHNGTTRLFTSGDTLQIGTRDRPRITIAQNGTIGIGNITEPKSQIHLDGSIRITNTILRGFSSAFIIQDQGQVSKVGLYNDFSEWSPNFNNNIKLGTSARRWSEIWSVNPINTSSDRRLKKEIEPIDYGLSAIMQLKPVSYKWKQGNQDTKLGFIAQDVTKVVPEIVKLELTTPKKRKQNIEYGREMPEVDYYAMSYTELIPVLVKAIQEQNQRINSLTAEIEKKDDIQKLFNLRLEKMEAIIKLNNQ